MSGGLRQALWAAVMLAGGLLATLLVADILERSKSPTSEAHGRQGWHPPGLVDPRGTRKPPE